MFRINEILFSTKDNLVYIKYIGPVIATFLYGSLFSAVVNGCGRNDLIFFIKIFARIIQLVLVYSLFKIHLGIFGLIASLIAHNIIILFGSILFSLRFLDLKYMKYNRKSAFEVLELGYAMFGGRLISSFIDPLFRIYLSKTAGLSSVGIFEISQKANSAFSSIPFSAFSNIPAQVMKISKGNNIVNNDILSFRKKIWTYLFLFSFPALLLAQALLPWLLHLWLGNFDLNILKTIRLLLITYFFHSFSMIDYNIMVGFGKTKINFYANLVTAISMTMSITFSMYFGFESYIALVKCYSIGILCGAIFIILYSAYFMYFQKSYTR